MIVLDEYLAIRVLGGDWPAGLPDDELGLPASRHWRLLQPVHASSGGQLSQRLAALPARDLAVIRHPHPEVQVLDPRPLLDDPATLAARYGGGLLIAETLAAGLVYGRALWFGMDTNVGRPLARAADEPGVAVHIHLTPQRAPLRQASGRLQAVSRRTGWHDPAPPGTTAPMHPAVRRPLGSAGSSVARWVGAGGTPASRAAPCRSLGLRLPGPRGPDRR